MSRKDLREIIARVVEQLEESAPQTACFFTDSCDVATKYGINEPDPNPCDMTSRYAIGEES